jgi:hypothetical protein
MTNCRVVAGVRAESGMDGTAGPSTTLRSPGFPVEVGGVGELHAAFRNESSTRGSVRRCAAGNPGPVGMTISFKLEDFARINKVTDSRDDKGEGGVYRCIGYEGWGAPFDQAMAGRSGSRNHGYGFDHGGTMPFMRA